MPSNITKTTHKSGLRLLSNYMPESPSITMIIFVHTGSRFENKDNNGVAHFFEHMVFKGTAKRPSPHQIGYDLEMIGADVNAYTDREYTAYFMRVIKSNLETGTEILFDAFLHSLLKDEEVEKERNVIKEEMKMYDDDPASFAEEKAHKNLFPNTSFGWEIVGTEESLNKINSNVIKEFYNSNYKFENTVISVAGNITHREVEELVNKYFDTSSYSSGSLPVLKKFENEIIDEEKTYRREIQQSQLRYSTFSVPFIDPNRLKIDIACDVLGSGMASKLFIEVREKLGLAYSIYSRPSHWTDTGSIVISAGLMEDKIKNVLDIVLLEMEKLSKGYFNKEDLKRAKEIHKASFLMDLDTTQSVAWYYGNLECLIGQYEKITDIINGIEAVSMEDVRTVMQNLYEAKWQTTIVSPKIHV